MGTKYKRLNTEDFGRIILLHSAGKSVLSIAEELGRSNMAVCCVIRAFNGVKNRDWKDLEEYVRTGNYSYAPVAWAAETMNVTVPEYLKEIFSEAKKKKNESDSKKRAEKAAELYAPKEPVQMTIEEPAEEAAHEAEAVTAPYVVQQKPQGQDGGLYLTKLLETLAQTNELLEQLMDVVLPRYVGDIKDNINANSDVMVQQMKSCGEALNRLVVNTRKRGL